MRLMLHRPPTHDTVAGLERFACLDIPATLTRSTCARRYTLALGIHATVKGEHTAQTREARACVVCVACPVGAIHASEAGAAVQGGRMRMQPTKARGDCLPREMRDVPAPPAVVPARRPKTPAHADVQHGSRERAPVSPVEIEILIPPSGDPVSTGQRPCPAAPQNGPENRRERSGARVGPSEAPGAVCGAL